MDFDRQPGDFPPRGSKSSKQQLHARQMGLFPAHNTSNESSTFLT